ncbi:MAG TPA: energy-coupling factor transporter transmembrane component T, partial [Treponemataceae bacterium]|nr:energy-coupling factor transporter transmembrane component T [Treponemataceae bacterium]
TGNPHPSDRLHGTPDSTRVSPGLVSSFTVPAAQRCANTLADRGLPVSRSAIRYDELCAEVLGFAKTCGTIHAKSSRRYSVSPDNLDPQHAGEAPQVDGRLTPAEPRHAGEAPIERVNPFVKLVLFICLAAAVLSANSVYSIAVLAAFALIIFAVSGSAGKECVARLSGLGWFFAFVFAMNFLFFSPETAFAQWWVFSPSAAGAVQGARIGFRIALVTAFAAVLTSSTTPVQLTGAIETLLFPLALFRVPVGEVAMILGIALRFIPVLQDEADLVRKAQTARGARWQTARGAHRKPPTGSRNQKARGARWKHRAGSGVAGLLPLVVPVCIAAFIRADELALAMEARGYQAGIRKQSGRKRLGNKMGRLVFIDAAAVFLTTLACMPILLGAL